MHIRNLVRVYQVENKNTFYSILALHVKTPLQAIFAIGITAIWVTIKGCCLNRSQTMKHNSEERPLHENFTLSATFALQIPQLHLLLLALIKQLCCTGVRNARMPLIYGPAVTAVPIQSIMYRVWIRPGADLLR